MNASKIVSSIFIFFLTIKAYALQQKMCMSLYQKPTPCSLFHKTSRWTFEEWVKIWYYRFKKKHTENYQKKLDEQILLSVKKGLLRRLQIYYASGADVNTTDQYGQTPLIISIYFAHIEHNNPKKRATYLACFDFLIALPDVDYNRQTAKPHYTPLMTAIGYDMEQVVQKMLHVGTALFLTTTNKETAEQCAQHNPKLHALVKSYTLGIESIREDLEKHIKAKDGQDGQGTRVAESITSIIKEYL